MAHYRKRHNNRMYYFCHAILAMNLIVKNIWKKCKDPSSLTGTRYTLPPHTHTIRPYMDDLTVKTSTITGGRWLLLELEKQTQWATMKFKHKKSRSVAIIKGKVVNRNRFKRNEVSVPTKCELSRLKALKKFER